MVELIINNNQVELPEGTNIKFTKQISDIFDIANVACSFTNQFSFDKTPANTQTMQQLGIPGDSSNIPYIKNDAILKSNGFDIVSKGWFNVIGTNDKYSGGIIDGMIDFFKAIENKTMGIDLDLKNFDHEKLLSTVVASFTNEYYQYIIADYGGKTEFEGGINIDYLAPCFSIRKLWELIFSTFNFNCDYTNLGYLDNLYITYPKDVAEGQENVNIANLTRSAFSSQQMNAVAGIVQPVGFYGWTTSLIFEGSLISNWKYVIPETTSYNFNIFISMYIIYRNPGYYNPNVDVTLEILKNGVVINGIISDFLESDTVGDERSLEFNQQCNYGDIIELRIVAPQNKQFRGRSYRAYQWQAKNLGMAIAKTNLGTTRLQNELKDFSIRDFVKEFIWRTGLTPLLNQNTNTVEFITLDSRIDFGNAQDMSHTYKERTGETYVNDYAQKNVFKLKRNDDTDNEGDGYLYVYNRNIEDQKTIAESKIYAPDKKIVTQFPGGFTTNQYKIWQLELKNDGSDILTASYKGLSGRFYFIRKENISGSFKIISEKLEEETTVSNIPIGINTDTLFEEAVFNNYAEYQKIFINFRVHTISQVLTENDFIGLDLTRPVFFRQENAYYICNKIPFSEGDSSVGEYIKINKV